MINWQRTVFLVDGQTEILSLRTKFQKEYRKSPEFRIVGCNGKSVTAYAYANKATPIIELCLNDKFDTVVCIVDKENRNINPKDFATQIQNEIQRKLSKNCFPILIICIPDRMIENWIIADIEGIKSGTRLIQDVAEQVDYDGQHGAKELDSIMKEKYKKTRHSKILFKHVDFTRAKKNSISFSLFHDQILT